ncbi:MAG: ATP-dependent metallopeptidase FtsH/Yme1/Tma family protein [Candidatus Paceibacterota bacterium]
MRKPSLSLLLLKLKSIARTPHFVISLITVLVLVIAFNNNSADDSGSVTQRDQIPAATSVVSGSGVDTKSIDRSVLLYSDYNGQDPLSKRRTEEIGSKKINDTVNNVNGYLKDVSKIATLVSLTTLEDRSSEYNVAWVDDKKYAVLLTEPKVDISFRRSGDRLTLPPLLAFYPNGYSDGLLSVLRENGVDVRVGPSFVGGDSESGGNWFLIIGILLLVFYLVRRYSNLRTSTLVSPTSKAEAGEIPSTRFSDVAGVNEAVEEMRELVTFLKEPERYEKTGAKPPRGALMSGPPGTGKTLLARAVAGEAGVPFFAVTGSDFTDTYVGVGPRRVRNLFAKAKQADRAIVFIDEVDAIARKRSSDGASGGQQETENTLIALLSEMDGFVGTHVIVLAATNRAELLDPALTRPGRLDRKISVPTPDRRGREEIFRVHSVGKPIDEVVDYLNLARRTPGMSGAEIAQIVNEACMEAARRGLESVDELCFDSAIATISMGRARVSALVTDSDKIITAWHEAGHTLCALLQRDADQPVSVSIIPRGPAGGVTWMAGSDEMFLPKRKAEARLVTAMGGRAAEEILLKGSYTQGAHGDLQSATNLALTMATQYGMTKLGLMVRNTESLAYGGMEEVNLIVEEMLNDALNKARLLLKRNRPFLNALVVELLDKETLTKSDIEQIYKKFKKVKSVSSDSLNSRFKGDVSNTAPTRASKSVSERVSSKNSTTKKSSVTKSLGKVVGKGRSVADKVSNKGRGKAKA